MFAKVHPLLTASQDDKDAYVSLSGFGSDSLLVPLTQKRTESPEAIFVIEAVVDLESVEGRAFAAKFIDMMELLPESVGNNGEVALAYRILPSSNSGARSMFICPLLASASKFDFAFLSDIMKGDGLKMSAQDLLSSVIPVMTDDSFTDGQYACSKLPYIKDELPQVPFITANGRVFAPEDGDLKEEDVELLINLETGKAKSITKLLKDDLGNEYKEQFDAIARASSFLAQQQSKSQGKRSDMESMVVDMENAMGIESNPLRFSWNDGDDNDDSLKVGVLFQTYTHCFKTCSYTVSSP